MLFNTSRIQMRTEPILPTTKDLDKNDLNLHGYVVPGSTTWGETQHGNKNAAFFPTVLATTGILQKDPPAQKSCHPMTPQRHAPNHLVPISKGSSRASILSRVDASPQGCIRTVPTSVRSTNSWPPVAPPLSTLASPPPGPCSLVMDASEMKRMWDNMLKTNN